MPGGGKSVQNNIAALWAPPDGRCYTNSFCDEAGSEDDRTGKPAGDAIAIAKSPGTIRGLTVAHDGTLLATDYDANILHFLRGGNLAEGKSFAADHPSRIVVAALATRLNALARQA